MKSLVPNFGYIGVLAFFALAGPFFLERFGRRAFLWLTVVTVCLAAFVAFPGFVVGVAFATFSVRETLAYGSALLLGFGWPIVAIAILIRLLWRPNRPVEARLGLSLGLVALGVLMSTTTNYLVTYLAVLLMGGFEG